MRLPLAAVALAALMLTPAAAQTPAAAAPAAAAHVVVKPAKAAALALQVCLSGATSAEALNAEAVKAGFGPFMPRQLQDPTGAALTYHQLAPGEFDGAPVLAVIRRRTISEPGQMSVEWTECGLTFEPAGQNSVVAAELARTLGPGRARGGSIGWAYRLAEGRPRAAILLPPSTGAWLPEIEVAQTLDPSERIATLTVAASGNVTWIQVGYFRLKRRGEL